MYPTPEPLVNAWAYFGKRNVDFIDSRCPGEKFMMIGPLTVEPSSFIPPRSAINTRYYSPPDDPPPISVI